MGDKQSYLIKQIVKFCQKLDAKGFGANHDGNISVRLDGNCLLATPTAVSKGNVSEDMIITLDMEGNKIAGIGKPFSEIKLHLAAYFSRSETQAVVHAHPPFATAMGLAGKELRPQLPEAVVSIGDIIPVAPFAMPGAKENAQIVEDMLQIADVFLAPGNGVFAIGDSVEMAYLRLELVEHVAKIQFFAKQMGVMEQLSAENMNTLLEKRAALGLGPKKAINNEPYDKLKEIIAAELKKVIN